MSRSHMLLLSYLEFLIVLNKMMCNNNKYNNDATLFIKSRKISENMKHAGKQLAISMLATQCHAHAS